MLSCKNSVIKKIHNEQGGKICLKAKAFIEQSSRKEDGAKIDEKDIRKHKNDVIRLAALLTENDSLKLPDSICDDMRQFMTILKKEPPDFQAIAKSMGLPSLTPETVINQINQTFDLKSD